MKDKKNKLEIKETKKKSHPFWNFFWLTFLVVSFWYAWYSFYVPTSKVIWSNDIVASKELANKTDKNILIFFTGKWCSPCRIMKREVFADAKVRKAIQSKVVPVEIDMDDPNSKNLINQYNIYTTPTTIIIDSKGNVVNYTIGKIEKTKFIEILLNK